jgi:hypothetical protein
VARLPQGLNFLQQFLMRHGCGTFQGGSRVTR